MTYIKVTESCPFRKRIKAGDNKCRFYCLMFFGIDEYQRVKCKHQTEIKKEIKTDGRH